MAKEAPKLVKEIDKWGADFEKLENGQLDQRFFGAHKYRRTCYSGDFTGLSILKTLLKKSNELNIPIYDNQYVTELLIKKNTCFGQCLLICLLQKELYIMPMRLSYVQEDIQDYGKKFI